MPKLRKGDPITARDLAEFVGSNSDFAFEMRVVAQLRALDFECSHSGTYRDPVTDKIRQFDIRAIAHRGKSTLALAVECKNLRRNSPLLLSAVPRTTLESFHDVLVFNPEKLYDRVSVRPVTGPQSAYRPGEMVGKKTDRVGRDASGTLVSDDKATFEKLNQAVNRCQDLVREYALKPSPPLVRAIVPLLVVPKGLLWQVDYDTDGNLKTPPRGVTRASLFLNHAWSADVGMRLTIFFRLSHIELATLDALPGIVDTYFGSGGLFSTVKEAG
jgi:hypothetical protein